MAFLKKKHERLQAAAIAWRMHINTSKDTYTGKEAAVFAYDIKLTSTRVYLKLHVLWHCGDSS